MRATLALVLACTPVAPPPPSNTAVVTEVPPQPPCPRFLATEGGGRSALAHDIAPGCGAMPFAYEFSVCTDACPRPCRETTSGMVETTIRDDYDDNGRWIAWFIEAGNPGIDGVSCLRAGPLMVRCATIYNATNQQVTYLDRDPSGRPVSMHDTSTETYRYANGDLVEANIDGRTIALVYDDAHRLIREDDTTYEYDRAGRLVRRTTDGITATYEYDHQGRLIAVRDAQRTDYVLDYDRGGRLVRVRAGDANNTSWDTTFHYDCR